MKKFHFCALAVAVFAAVAAQVPAAADSSGPFYVVTLGTGIPIPNPDRASAATLIVAGERSILIDTGRNALIGLVGSGLQSASIILFTHFHSDHIAGFGELMVGRGIAGVDTPQVVLGPVGTQGLVDDFLAVYSRDTSYRVTHHGEHWPANAMKADVTESEAGVIYDEDGLRITMFDVNHEPIFPAVGYRIDYAGKSVVVSGDTRKSEKLIEMAQDCDLLVHEAMNAPLLNRLIPGLKRGNPRQAAMLEDMMSHHTAASEVAEIARDAKVKQVVLTHLVPSIPPTDAAEKAFTMGLDKIYSGPIHVARDGMRFTP